jgi:hypothetical protein
VLSPTTVITFDDLPPGTVVTNQYHGQGVDLSGLPPPAGQTDNPVIKAATNGVVAHSGSQVLNITVAYPGKEFPSPAVAGQFTNTVSQVSAWVGLLSSSGGNSTHAELDAYDANNQLVGKDIEQVTSTNFNTQLSVSSATANITHFIIWGDTTWKLGIDDLSFVAPPAQQPDFNLAAASTTVDVAPGGTAGATDTITINRLNGSTGNIQFQAVGLPSGVTASFSPNPAGNTSTTMTVTAAFGAALTDPNGVTFTVQGTPVPSAGTASRSTTPLTLHVRPDFSVSVDEPGNTVVLVTSVDVPIKLQRPLDFNGTISLSTLIGLPAGITPTFNPTTLKAPDDFHGTAFATSTLTLTRTPGTSFTNFTMSVVASGNGQMYMAPLAVTSYRSTDGFAFENYANTTAYTLADLSELFGAQATYGPVGSPPDPFVAQFLNLLNTSGANNGPIGSGGQCYGISRVDVQMLFGNRQTSGYPRQPAFAQVTNPTIWQLDGPPRPSTNLEHDILVQQAAYWSAESVIANEQEITAHSASSFTAADLFGEINRDLGIGGHPLINIFWKGTGSSGLPVTHGHTVVAYALENDASAPGAFWIDTYDSNEPFLASENTNATDHASREAGSRIHVDSKGNWSITYSGFSSPWAAATLSTLWMNTYAELSVKPTYPSQNQLYNFFDMMPIGTAATTQVTDSAGHTLINPDGTQNLDPATRLPHALRLFPPEAAGDPAGTPLDVVPAGGTYTQTVTGTGTGAYSEYMLGHDFAVTLNGVPAAPGVADQLTVTPTADSFTFHSGAASKALAAEFIVQPPGGPARVVDAHTTTFGGGSDAFAFDAARQAITVTHKGAAAPLSLTFRQPDPAGVVEYFTTGPITLAPGDVATVTPSNWSSLTSSTATLTITHADGTQLTVTLPNQLTQQPPITVLLKRVHGSPALLVSDASTGAPKFRFFPFGKSYRGPIRFVVADLNWDGTYEIAVVQGKGGRGTVRVFNGRTGALEYTLRPFRKAAGQVQLSVRESHGVWFLTASARQKGKMVRHVFGGPGLQELPATMLS